MLREPLTTTAAKALARKILVHGATRFSGHGLKEMKKDSLSEADAINVIRAGVARPAELENGSWRYRFETQKIVVVVSFRCPDDLELEDELKSGAFVRSKIVVVTAWRNKERTR